MVEHPTKRELQPLTREEVETAYFALIELLTSNFPIDETRRARLKALVARLSEHARQLEIVKRTSSGLTKKVDPVERQDLIRKRLLCHRPPEERGTWAVYAEGVSEAAQQLLLTIVEGTWAEAIERALAEPGFITDGMGGQIDPIGIEPSDE